MTRAVLTVASSGTPCLPWWRDVSLPSAMVDKAMGMVLHDIAERTPSDGVAITIRLHPTPVAPRPCVWGGCNGVGPVGGCCNRCGYRTS